MDRKPLFDTVRELLGRGFTQAEVRLLDAAIDLGLSSSAGAQRTGPWSVGIAGEQLIRKWESCARRRPDGRFEAYPDPGSTDGRPWTIGWGSTGPGIAPGVIWDQQQCDERLAQDLKRYADEVARAIGTAPATQNQFDALVSFHYNTGAIGRATLTKKHKAGDFAAAKAEFGKWIYAGNKPMDGLRKRRADEARLYEMP